MHPRTAVITGAAGGLGQATAQQLLDAGLDVVAVTRDARGAGAVLAGLRAGDRTVHVLHADLVDRAEVGELAQRLRATVGRVDVLVNNAGSAFPRYAETADGVERTHALNHLAAFHLTHLLLAGGQLAGDARIINISSDMVTRGRLTADAPDVTGVTWRDRFSQLSVYGTAKLAALLATTALAARLPAGMSAYSANPGVIRTGFNAKSGGLLKAASAVTGLFAQTPQRAAATPVVLATAGSAPTPSGGLFARGTTAPMPKQARDATLAAAVYERSALALGLAALPRR